MAKKKAKTDTPVLVAVDASGSMYRVKDDVIGGFNQYMDDLRNDADNSYRVTLVTFDTVTEKVFMGLNVGKVPNLSDATYTPRGATALLDAIGVLVSSYVPVEGDRPPLVVVHTDGKENASHEWRLGALQQLIKDRTEQGWQFVFLGAGLDTWQQGDTLGMYSASTVDTRQGTIGLYSGLSTGTRAYASGGATGQSIANTVHESSEAADGE